MTIKILLLDIETSPLTAYVWGLWDQNIGLNQIIDSSSTLCWAARWLGEKEVMFDSVHKSGHTKMIERIHALVDEADAVVHYNGRKFDMPVLHKEFLLLGMAPPAPYKDIDLLKVVRQKFRFPSNKLDYVSQALGIGNKVKHMGMGLWKDCMAGDGKAWKLMEKYNKQDVVLLEKLYNKLLGWIPNHPNHGLYVDSDTPVCRNCGTDKLQLRGFSFTTTGKYQRYQCKCCGSWGRGKKMLGSAEVR